MTENKDINPFLQACLDFLLPHTGIDEYALLPAFQIETVTEGKLAVALTGHRINILLQFQHRV